MGKFLGSMFFLAALGFVGWLVLTDMDNGDVFNDVNDAELRTTATVASRGEDVVEDLDAALEAALRNSEKAIEIANDIEEASGAAYSVAGDVSALEVSNDAAAASRLATVTAAQNADRVAALMRSYAAQIQAKLREVEQLANEAEAAAQLVASVEESRVEARRAAERAREAEEELIDAARNAEITERTAGRRGSAALTGAAVIEEAPATDDGPEAIIVVPIDELEQAEATPYDNR